MNHMQNRFEAGSKMKNVFVFSSRKLLRCLFSLNNFIEVVIFIGKK
jgi:hypothetical protein